MMTKKPSLSPLPRDWLLLVQQKKPSRKKKADITHHTPSPWDVLLLPKKTAC